MHLLARTTTLIALLAGLAAALPTSAQTPVIPPYNRADAPGDVPPVPSSDASGEVQGRGPLHEGFAQPGGGVGQPSAVVPKQPPQPIPETPPETRPAGDNVAWIPGYWSWDEDRRDFLWVSGFWRVMPDGRRWVSGYWANTDDGWRWVSGLWASSGQAETPYLPTPPQSLDRGPSLPPPEADNLYVPGCWIFDDSRWLWRPGYWSAPRAGLVYTPAHYGWTPRGYLYASGFWDRPLASRGVPFAPVYFGADFAPAADWSYQPQFAVDVGAVLDSLWVGPGASCYAFGDYYAPRYARAGYQSWLSYGPHSRDPLYGYYRNANRGNPNWRGNLVATHNGRLRGTVAVPPSSLAAQGRTRDASLRTVTPLASYRNNSLRMAAVTPAERRNRDTAAAVTRQGTAARQVTEGRSAPRPRPVLTRPRETTQVPLQRSPSTGNASRAPLLREVPRTTRPASPSVIRSTSVPTTIARPRSVEPPTRYTPPPVQRHTAPAPPPARYTPPVQRHTAPAPPPAAARYTPPPVQRHTAPAPPARSAPPLPKHSSGKH